MPNLVRGPHPPMDRASAGSFPSARTTRAGPQKRTTASALTAMSAARELTGKAACTRCASVACTSCHTIMKSVSAKYQLKTAFQPETCFQCHKDRRAQMFRSSHMPMREGKIVCSDCHNPHGSVTEKLIRENSVNDNCYKCHAEKRGPFLFEHAPVRENCLNCHDPHGSINEFSLKMSRPRLCYRVPHARPLARRTGREQPIHDGPLVPELPYPNSWQQQSGGCGFPTVSWANR